MIHLNLLFILFFAVYEWIDKKEYETEFEFNDIGTSYYLSGKLMLTRMIELP
ncbi:hypothetical protein [Metabacillus litoralis]|uniref:hypothetical protein n=1 Tax=Metabacillus litoralis TaxID=152268 RepID=UPI00203EDD85|nr:hypothetical protein [Metabacillus litoralis]MCM3162701.1 hypothetical protein [Metabacillus litoralis]